MRIGVIVPVSTRSFVESTKKVFVDAAPPSCEIAIVGFDKGPAPIECDYEDATAVPDVLDKVTMAEREGVDAVIVDCMADPGLGPARELVSTPVVGVAQASMHCASILAQRFSVVTILHREIPIVDRIARKYGLGDRLASTRSVDIPVLDLEKDKDHLLNRLAETSIHAIQQDGAHAILLGCTGMRGMARELKKVLQIGD